MEVLCGVVREIVLIAIYTSLNVSLRPYTHEQAGQPLGNTQNTIPNTTKLRHKN